MTIEYSCISRGATILCSHQIGAGDFENVAEDMLRNVPTRTDNKVTYQGHNNYAFHCVVENGIIYMCVSAASFGKRQPYAFLTEIKRMFQSGSLASRAITALPFELNRDFAQVLAQNMEKFSSSSGGDNMSAVQKQVNEVKGIMTQNIEKVLERGEKLDTLVERSEELEGTSKMFSTTARKVRKKYWWKNTKMTICLVCTVIIVIIVLTLIILFSTGVLPPKSSDSGSTTATTPTTAQPGVRRLLQVLYESQ
ncbi:vesicle-associated membrane protein 7 [Lingula anatina]|uniref:Vesicle-associated membrane protein 7 n=1 Tax=Lingula anatina TaxID=7574 RepID=A0A1S3JAF2_LINAN|nr:vesicle-associated membrane protein 7 [Lingula anatina]|eukprot:XP_013407377.1 vesicle-associated membrane protein 7 [Lingula anatina]